MSCRSRKTSDRDSVIVGQTMNFGECSPGGVVQSRELTIRLKESFSARSIWPVVVGDEKIRIALIMGRNGWTVFR